MTSKISTCTDTMFFVANYQFGVACMFVFNIANGSGFRTPQLFFVLFFDFLTPWRMWHFFRLNGTIHVVAALYLPVRSEYLTQIDCSNYSYCYSFLLSKLSAWLCCQLCIRLVRVVFKSAWYCRVCWFIWIMLLMSPGSAETCSCTAHVQIGHLDICR